MTRSTLIVLVLLYTAAIASEVFQPNLNGINYFLQLVLLFTLFKQFILMRFSQSIFLMLKAYFIVFIVVMIALNNIFKAASLEQLLVNPYALIIVSFLISGLLLVGYLDKKGILKKPASAHI